VVVPALPPAVGAHANASAKRGPVSLRGCGMCLASAEAKGQRGRADQS
jgi:hypothetical protein